MRRRRIGILNPTGVIGWGGGFQYVLSLIVALSAHDDLEVVVFYDDPKFDRYCAELGIEGVRLPADRETLGKLSRGVCGIFNSRSPFLGRFDVLRNRRLDCLISSSSLAGFHLRIPFVAIIYDVMHKYYPDCAEYPWRTRLWRDVLNRKLGRLAAVTVVDSEKSRDDLVRFYAFDSSRIVPIPLCPPPHADGGVTDALVTSTAAKYNLPERFIFYPAQLWDHKNHRRLFEALVRLRDRDGLTVPAVMVGSKTAQGHHVLEARKALHLEQQVRYLGYVEDRELAALYQAATALVFPSFGDYTNIPVLEAMALGTPVVCSNLFAMPEQLGDAGLLFDPFDVDAIAKQIRRVWRDADLRAELTRRGRRRVSSLSIKAFGTRWHDVIAKVVADGAVHLRPTWPRDSPTALH